MEEEIEKPKRSNAKNIEKGREFVNSILNNEEEIKKIEEQQKKEIAELERSVDPIGGYGASIQTVKSFEQTYRNSQVEYGLQTSLSEEPNYVYPGSPGAVNYFTENFKKYLMDWYTNYSDKINVHVHPLRPYSETDTTVTYKSTDVIDESFSESDIIFHISFRSLESRIISRYSTYVMQEPKMGWDVYEQTYSEFKRVFTDDGRPTVLSSLSNKIKELYQYYYREFFLKTYNIAQNDKEFVLKGWFGRTGTHYAVSNVCKYYGFPYARYSYKELPKRKTIFKTEKKQSLEYKFFDEQGRPIN